MIKASIIVHEAYTGNRLFDLTNPCLNRDDCLYPYVLLREHLAERGILLATQDKHRPEDSDLIICNEMPRPKLTSAIHAKKILLLFETEIIRPDNWNLSAHKSFDIVFTWHDGFAGHGRYRKFNFPNKVPANSREISARSRSSLCAMIAGNKSSHHPLELYSERLSAIEWFERNRPNDFALYGKGWDCRTFYGLLRPLNKLPALRHTLTPFHPSYRGEIVSKLETYSNYRFAICYENAIGIPGYITEKIFDCLFAGCIPVYLGAPNIAEYIPSDCFINRNAFNDYLALYTFLMDISEPRRKCYVEAAMDFINGADIEAFGSERFAAEIANAAVDILNKDNS
ncbi:MAG: glycosyltransferase family 10 [Nitrospirota bacterium]|nr:glycosyltransferase family 10 [Nitrospirota bacterium]